jgi:osmotically-inducible protein OsmY
MTNTKLLAPTFHAGSAAALSTFDDPNAPLRQSVLDELTFEPSVNATHVAVATNGNVVTLTGHVGSYTEKLQAIKATRRVKGVQGIADEIEVRWPSDKKTADDEIAQRAVDILNWDATIPQGAVQITVRDGWVTLSGQVPWHFQRKAAEDDIRKLSGVRAVLNSITITPQAGASDIKQKIEWALKRRAESEARSIRVEVEDGKVTLEGAVGTWGEIFAAENAAWSTPGVTSVDARLILS